MWRGLSTFGLRVLLYGANLFLVICFSVFFINYFQINDIEYFKTSKIYRILFLIYLGILILVGGLCIRRVKVPLAIYRIYLILLIFGVAFASIYLICDLDKSTSVVKKFEADINQINDNGINLPRVDHLQIAYKCCGLESSKDYINVPKSCYKTLKSNSSNSSNRSKRDISQDLTSEKKNKEDEFGINYIDEIFVIHNKNMPAHKYNTHLEPVKKNSYLSANDKPDDDQDYYNEGCLGKLEKTYYEQKSVTVKILITTICSSISAVLLICILIFVNEEDDDY